MRPVSLNFSEIADRVEQLSIFTVDYGLGCASPFTVVKKFAELVEEFKGRPALDEALALLSSIPAAKTFDVDDNLLRKLLSPAKTGVDFDSVIQACLQSAYEQILAPSFERVVIGAFLEGFQESCDRVISLAEKGIEAYPRSPVLKREQIELTRAAFERVVDGTGTREDFTEALFCQRLISELLWIVPEHMNWEYHELDHEECTRAAGELIAYANLVTEPNNLLDAAYAAIQNKYQSKQNPSSPALVL